MATHSSVLAWRIPGTGEPGGLPSMGSHRVRHDWSDLAVAAVGNVPGGKTTSPFRYDLNQIPHDYTVEVMNRCEGLDLVDRVPEEVWTEVWNFVQEGVTKTIPKKEVQESKVVAWGCFTISWEKKRSKSKGEREVHPTECRVPENSKER